MNYIRILSKSSLLSSSSSLKSITPSEVVTKLQTEIDKLRQTVVSLKLTVESRDAAIGTLAREKEKLYVELKSAQRTNRNLHQQLEDERDMHSKEKEYLIEEIKRVANRNGSENNNNYFVNPGDGIDDIFREEMRSKDEVIYNICTKYLKVKKSKTDVLRDFKELQSESQTACENIIVLLEENKSALDDLLRKLIEYSKLPPDTKKYFKILRHNAKLHYENTQLKVHLASCLHKNLVRNQKDADENNFVKKLERKQNLTKPKQFKKCSKILQHEKIDFKICLSNTICKTTSPFLIYKSNSDTCLTLLRKEP